MLALLLTLALSTPRVTVTAQTATTQDVTIAWDASAVTADFGAAKGYTVLHGTDCAALTDAGSTADLSYLFTALPKSTPHCFAVRAFNDKGASALSATVLIPASQTDVNPCRQASGANVLAVKILGASSSFTTTAPGYVAFQVLDYSVALWVTSVAVFVEGTSERIAYVPVEQMANPRVWAAVFIRPTKVGRVNAYVRVTNGNGCAAESPRFVLNVK